MRGFVDLHCHWVAAIDDGARTVVESLAMLRGLHQAGFDAVVATPHMRPGMYDNDRTAIERAFAAMTPSLTDTGDLPAVLLASEHFFDDVVYGRLVRGEALPYPKLPPLPRRVAGAPGVRQTHGPADDEGGRAQPAVAAHPLRPRRPVLIEFGPNAFPVRLQHRLFDLQRAGLVPVIAHPERYEPVWRNDGCLDPLLDAGAHLLLDVCSLVGKYGRAPQRAAEKLLDEDGYEAACSDAHKAGDVESVALGIERLERLVGAEETRRLLAEGPQRILEGR